jgi:hypothetical protein
MPASRSPTTSAPTTIACTCRACHCRADFKFAAATTSASSVARSTYGFRSHSQAVRIDDISGCEVAGNHSDVLQPWFAGNAGVRVDRFTGASNFQG